MCENLDFWRLDHCILYSFLRGFSLWQRCIVSMKQMMVYDQITFFYTILDFYIFMIFFQVQLIWENIAKLAENAHLPRIPIKTRGFLGFMLRAVLLNQFLFWFQIVGCCPVSAKCTWGAVLGRTGAQCNLYSSKCCGSVPSVTDPSKMLRICPECSIYL